MSASTLRHALCAAATVLLAASGSARAEPPVIVPPSQSAAPLIVPPPQSAVPLRYRVVIEAPKPLDATLKKSLDLVRWQGFEDMTAVVLDRLIHEGIDQAKEAAAAEGYFSARVDIAVEPPTPGDASRVVRVKVDPGEPTLIRHVNLQVTGPATGEALGEAAIAKLEREWRLPPGQPFRQVTWDAAKVDAVATLAASPYAGAALTHSEARIDPATRSATLDVEIASGPEFHFGTVQVQGLDKYDDNLVRNFSTITPGEPYTTERLDQYVRRLQASGYFASVQARIETDPALANAAPVRIAVIESPRKRIEGGVAYSTDNAFRADLRYTDVNINGRATQLAVDARLDRTVQNLGLRLTRPPTASGYLDSLRAQVERTDIAGLQTRTALLGVQRQTLDERNQSTYGLTEYEDDQRPSGAPAERSRALYASLVRSWRNVDALVDPSRGYVLSSEVGASLLGTRLFGRTVAQFAAWVPAGSSNTLLFRAEAGAVLAGSRSGVPSALLFRTGGDTTVRGYAFESLGVKRGDAIVGGRYYVVGSAEAAHYFTERLGAAVFVDAGNAADSLSDLRPVFGYGVGLRVKSPVGPFRFDVAYGQASRQVRLHMSVGTTF